MKKFVKLGLSTRVDKIITLSDGKDYKVLRPVYPSKYFEQEGILNWPKDYFRSFYYEVELVEKGS